MHLTKQINDLVSESSLPNNKRHKYKSTVGIYGGKLEELAGTMRMNMSGLVSVLDRNGDYFLRIGDERSLGTQKQWQPNRYRGKPEEISKNIERLGLEDQYESYKDGIEIKDQNLYYNGIALQDIFRAENINSDFLRKIDRFESLKTAVAYINTIHETKGAIGELLPSDIIFRDSTEKNEIVSVEEPLLNVPDIVFNTKKEILEIDKKTTDILDFVISITLEEFRNSGSNKNMKQVVATILENYENKDVIKNLLTFIENKQFTLHGIFGLHNKARLNYEMEDIDKIMNIINECIRTYLET